MSVILFAASGWVADFYNEIVLPRHEGSGIQFHPDTLWRGNLCLFSPRAELQAIFPGFRAEQRYDLCCSALVCVGGSQLHESRRSSLAACRNRDCGDADATKDFLGCRGLRACARYFDFGKHATGIYFFGQIGKSAPELIIGRVLGMAPVAFFSRANGLSELFQRTVVRAVLPVCLPYFAHESRNGEDMRNGYLRTVPLTLRQSVGPSSCFSPQWPSQPFAFCTEHNGLLGSLAQVLCIVAAV